MKNLFVCSYLASAFCFCIVLSNNNLKQDLKSCYVCDTLKGDTYCSEDQETSHHNNTKLVKRGGLGWPVCFTTKSLNNSNNPVVERNAIHHFDGTAEWSPSDFTDCQPYYDPNLQLEMKVCLCYTDNCNYSDKLDHA